MISWIMCGVLFVALVVSLRYNYRHAKILLDVEDALSVSLDVLDEGYRSLASLLDMPVFHDSTEIKYLVFQVKKTRDSVLYVSNVLAEPFGGVIDETEDEEVSD